MVAKLCAVCLVVLATLPFSAPFSTCDLADLLGDTHPANWNADLVVQAPPSAQDDDATLQSGLPFFRKQFELVGTATVGSHNRILVAALVSLPHIASATPVFRDPLLTVTLRL